MASLVYQAGKWVYEGAKNLFARDPSTEKWWVKGDDKEFDDWMMKSEEIGEKEYAVLDGNHYVLTVRHARTDKSGQDKYFDHVVQYGPMDKKTLESSVVEEWLWCPRDTQAYTPPDRKPR